MQPFHSFGRSSDLIDEPTPDDGFSVGITATGVLASFFLAAVAIENLLPRQADHLLCGWITQSVTDDPAPMVKE
jgi:hypothetical protein